MDSYQSRHNRHTIYIERLATHLFNEHIATSLDSAYKAARLVLLDNDTITSLSKLNRVTASVRVAISEILANGWDNATKQLEDTAIYEAGFYSDMFNESNEVALAVPADKKILSSVTNSLMTLHSGARVKVDVWSDFVKKNTSYNVDMFNAQIKIGFSNSETLNQITKRLRTVKEGLLKRDAETLVRTGMSHYASQSREALMLANKRVVLNKYFNSVFDNRRTAICSSYSVKPLFSIDDPNAPVFPLHFGERSSWLYLVEGQSGPFGTRSAVGGVKGEAAKEAYEKRKTTLAKRRSNENITGETTSKVKYRGKRDKNIFKPGQIKAVAGQEWYRDQPLWYLESNMGKGKAALFKAGKIDLDGLVDQYGKPLTLAQLKASGV